MVQAALAAFTYRLLSTVGVLGRPRPSLPAPNTRDDRKAPLSRARDGLMISRIYEKWKMNFSILRKLA